MTTGEEPPLLLRSTVDPDCDCVLVDPEAAAAAPPAAPADPEDEGAEQAEQAEPLCPPGYVPRLRPRSPYDLHGKEVVTTDPPAQNPEQPPAP